MSQASESYGRYRLLEHIGTGSAAEAWKAKSFGVEGFEKTLVIKRVLPELTREPHYVESFVREAQLAVRLSHANIAQVFDLGRVETPEGPSYFLAMEWVPGLRLSTLSQRLRRAGGVPLPLALWVGAEIAKALDHAHRRRDEQLRPLGIVHRDLSLDSIRCTWDGEVKVTDFCVVGALYALRDHGQAPASLALKLATASPELWRGQRVDFGSDLYSLGSLLFELLTGQSPLGEGSVEARERRLLAGELPRLSQLRPDVPEAVALLVERALALSPEDRFESAAALYEELMAALYSSSARFGATELAELVERHRDETSPGAPESRRELPSVDTQDFAEATGEHPAPAPRKAAAAALASSALEERREAAVLVVEFTRDVPAELGAKLAATLSRYGARLLSQDARRLVGCFGLDAGDGRETENAVQAALVLARSLGTTELPFSLGIGAGPLRTGPDGLPMQQDELGALLHRAERHAAYAPGGVGLGERAADQLRGRFELQQALPTVGLEEPTWLVLEARRPEDVYGRFVGRKPELRRLGELIAAASRRAPQLATLSGPQGIGKTRLVVEMARRLVRGSFKVAAWRATCPPRGRETPLSAAAEMLRILTGLREGDDEPRVAAVEPRLRALGLHDEEVAAVLGELGVTRHAGHSAALAAAFARMVTSMATENVQVLVWDDAQEMDDASLAWLSEVRARLGNSRVLIVLVGRTNDTRRWAPEDAAAALLLGPLDDDDTFRLVALRANLSQVPEELFEFVKSRAGGHPMVVEELLLEASASGALHVEDGRVTRLDLDGTLAVPRPLRRLLEERLRRLAEPARRLLIATALLEPPADLAVLSALLTESVATLSATAEQLVTEELLLHDGPVGLRVRSPLLLEVIVASVEADALAGWHRRAAAALEQVAGAPLEETLPRIAAHLAEAGDREGAAERFADSAARAVAQHRLERAAYYLGRALELTELPRRPSAELARWLGTLTRALQHVRSGARVIEPMRRVARHLEHVTDLGAIERACTFIDLARSFAALHRYDDARHLLARAEDLAGSSASTLQALHAAAAELALRRGELSEAVTLAEHALREGCSTPEDHHRLLIVSAQALAATGDAPAALARVDQAAAIAPSTDPVLSCERAKVRALILGFSGDWRGCAAASELAARQGQAAGLRHEVAINLHNVGDALLHLGELPRAYAALQASLDVAREIGADRMENLNRLVLAYLDAINGSEAASQELARRIARAEEERWQLDALQGRLLHAVLQQHRGDGVAASRELTLVLQEARATGNALLTRDCEAALAKLSAAPS